jgi:hypothetical protein
MDVPQPDPELWESSLALIAESRRGRAELDALWRLHLRGRERVNDHCLSLLTEAKARLDARELARAGQAQDAIDRLS